MPADKLLLTRQFKAPPARVFAAFTEKSLIQSWYGPEGYTIPQCDIDVRVGGKYRIEMHSATGVSVVTGEFREIRAPERLVYSWAWLQGPGKGPETLVTLTFKEKDGGTELTLEHTGFATEEACARHRSGWESSMASLENMLAGRPKSDAPTPTVMGVAQSSYVQAARIALMEKGIAHAHEPWRPHSPEILAQNPFGKVPAFRCGDVKLYETSAIMHYVNDAFPGPALLPEAPAARAKAEQWISAFNCYGYPTMISRYALQYFFPRGADNQPDRATIDGAVPEIRKLFAALDEAYGEGDYLAGDALSLADILLAPPLRYVGLMPEGKEMFASFANVRRAHEKFASRPSFIQATQPPPA
jgi:glutathione S-transferase